MTVPSSTMSSSVSTSRGMLPSARLDAHGSNSGTPGSFGQSVPEFNDTDETGLLSVSWNQDHGCFAAGTTHGFRIYSCDPFKEIFRRDLKSGGFGIVEMLFRSNILALVGAGTNSQYPPSKVIIWDDYERRCIDLKLLQQIETLANPRGLCCLSHHSNTFVLACPGLQRGLVRIEHFGLNMTKLIKAHDSHVACLTLTMDGLLLASASMKGTLIRIFNTMDGTRLQEVRRGSDNAEIYSIALSPNVQWLAVSSEKGTVHIFNLRVRVVGEDSSNHSITAQGPAPFYRNSSNSLDALISPNAGANPGSSLSFMKGFLPKYFSSEWSFAQFRVPEDTQFIATFGSQNTVIIVGMDGSFYRCSFDHLNGGEMLQQEYHSFLKKGHLES